MDEDQIIKVADGETDKQGSEYDEPVSEEALDLLAGGSMGYADPTE